MFPKGGETIKKEKLKMTLQLGARVRKVPVKRFARHVNIAEGKTKD